MLHSVKELEGYAVQASDGEMGKIDNLFFEEDSWIARYLIVKVGNWMLSERVLLIPDVVEQIDPEQEVVSVILTREQVKESPEVDAHKPLSRKKEIALHEYYQWQPYWASKPKTSRNLGAYPPAPGTWDATETPAMGAPPPQKKGSEGALKRMAQEDAEGGSKARELRSGNEVIGYDIQANDGEIGHVEDFIVDTKSWIVRYLVVDTRDWLPGRKVLVSSTWITSIYWADSEVYVDLTQEEIKSSPEYDEDEFVTRQYEAELHEHYQKPKYWQH